MAVGRDVMCGCCREPRSSGIHLPLVDDLSRIPLGCPGASFRLAGLT